MGGPLAAWHPVGTGGGCGDGRGPCACPRRNMIRLGFIRPTACTPTRTGTRPPHPLHPSPCPYRTRPHIIPSFGRKYSSEVFLSNCKTSQVEATTTFYQEIGCQNWWCQMYQTLQGLSNNTARQGQYLLHWAMQ